MAEVNFHFDLKLGPEKLRWTLACLFVLAAAPELGSETVTLSTYYPAPSGVYVNMITTGNTYLARDGGAVGVQNSAPARTLDVTGTFRATSNADVGGNLAVTGSETVGGNITVTGSATIGNGEALTGALSGAYGLIPSYAGWASYGTGAGGAAIYNDNGSYRKLMIVGNNSAGGGREVGIWDNMTVNGAINVSGRATISQDVRSDFYIAPGITTTAGCRAVNATPNTTVCNAGEYATANAGVYSRYALAPVLITGNYQVSPTITISVLCCSYSSGGSVF